MRRSFGQTSEGESVHFWSREKDEEAIALGTTLEQSFAIGPEAGGVEKGDGRVQMGKNSYTHTKKQTTQTNEANTYSTV